MRCNTISVIIPAFNEESYLPKTVRAVACSAALLESRHGVRTEVIVVDNSSTDGTATVARSLGASVAVEPEHNVARARNRGAASATGQLLLFLDADTLVPEELLPRIHQMTVIHGCLGGAVDTEYRPQKRTLRLYLGLWRILSKLAIMAQGATQFATRDAFFFLGGYDESLFMAEDVDFYSRLRKHARQIRSPVCLIRDLRVLPSTRRFDRWPLWRTLLWTNPLVIAALRRVRSFWQGWYDTPVR